MSNYELRQHQRKDKIKWIGTGIAFVLVFVFLIGLCMQLFGTGKVKPSEWFKKNETEQTTPDDTDKDNVNVSVDENNSGLKLTRTMLTAAQYEEYGVSAQAESAYTVTATVKDETGASPDYLQSGTFNLKWASTNSAKITDYITLSQSGMTATFSVLKAFSTQALLTFTSDLDTTKTATATIDYVKRVEGLTVGLNSINLTGGSWNFTMPSVSADTSDTFYTTSRSLFSIRFGTGSKDTSVTQVTYEIKATDTFKSACASAGSTEYLPCTGVMSATPSSNIPSITMLNVFQTCVGSACVGYPSARYALFRALEATSNQFIISGTIYTNKGNYAYSYYLNFSAAAPAIASTKLSETVFEV